MLLKVIIFFRRFFGWVKIWNLCDFIRNFVYQNFRKSTKSFYFQSLDRGMNKIKTEYIFELYITQAFFCPMSQNFNTTRSGD